MPPYNAAHAKFNMAANMAPVAAAPGPPVPKLADSSIIPAGRNKKNTFAEDANDVITFVQAVVAIVLPEEDYDCKGIVDSNGQLTKYFITLRLGIIAYILTVAGHGRLTKTAMAALGTLREMENSAKAGVKVKWDDFQ